MIENLQSSFETVLETLLQRPLLLVLAMTIPLFLIARFTKTYPTRLMLWFVSFAMLLSAMMLVVPMVIYASSPAMAQLVGTSLTPILGWIIVVVDGVLLAVFAVDLLWHWLRGSKLSATRQVPHVASLGKPAHAEMELINAGKLRCWLTVKDDFTDAFDVEPSDCKVSMAGQSRLKLHYQITPRERGEFELDVIHVRLRSGLGFWQSFRQLPCPDVVNVYPDMQQISEYELLAKSNRLSLMGLRRTRKIGQDNEFERLRDYTQDDNYKHIDWRSTARRRKLTVRDFQANQSQRVIFLIDSGRMMTGTVGGLTLLDYSLNAMLMLAYVALKQGDSVGMISFSDRIHNFTPVRPGVRHINRLLHASFNQQADYVESRYDEAFLYLRNHCRKRSLVILMTNVIDEINAIQIRQYLGKMTGQHLPLGVLLRDHELFSAVDDVDYENRDSLYQASAAVEVLSWRQQVIRDLKHQGVLVLDTFPEQLTASVVNQYLDIKARHLL
jgi:uncharacterized protein (DUF58 family)